MRYGSATLFLVLALSVGEAQAQSHFIYSRVQFGADNRVDVERARRDYDGNVFIFFYKKDHPATGTADSTFLSNERISALLNEKYERSAIDLESVYADVLFSQVEIGGPIDQPFVLLLNVVRPAHQGIWSDWDYDHELPHMDTIMLDRLYWQLSNFAEYGTVAP